MKRAHWIGDVMGEKRTHGENGGTPAFWNALALKTQRAVIEKTKAVELGAVGANLGVVTHSPEQAVGDPRGAAAAHGHLLGAGVVDLDV